MRLLHCTRPRTLSIDNRLGCPCGYAGDPTRECTCAAGSIARYQKRISGLLLDRIDIHVEVPRVACEKLTDWRDGERSADMRAWVQVARSYRTTGQCTTSSMLM